ncbi:hypothetical protein [Borrelia crocidurae]|uniref:Lipoprotein n=1 Tax=Borrelia crocidurae (strain Achema) TaxID=1155096 RepID=I0FE50_BORCA|nr:hypothetical protein [Borrelia crocidurae]AFI31756.1 hypothetical protein Q7M_1048 [Borrelia crocidurae str. Achema]
MTKVGVMLCFFAVLFLCCRQGNIMAEDLEDSNFEETKERKKNKRGRFGYYDLNSLEQAYDELSTSLNNLRALYYYRDNGFNISLFSDIDDEFRIKDNIFIMDDNVYAVLHGSIDVVGNLKKIVIDVNEDQSSYMYNKFNGHSLVAKLDHISQFTIFAIMKAYYDVKGNQLLEKLKYSKDIEGLKKIKLMIDDFCVEWAKLVAEVQKIINDVAVFADAYIKIKNTSLKEDEKISYIKSIEDGLRPIAVLDISNSNQSCSDSLICKLKNELVRLATQILDKGDDLLNALQPQNSTP